MKTKQFSALLDSHAKELLREPAVLFWGILFPLLMTLGLGIAFTQRHDITRKIAVIENENDQKPGTFRFMNFLKEKTGKIKDSNNGQRRYKLTVKDKKLGTVVYIFEELTWKEAEVLLKRGEINLIVEDADEDIKYHFDPVNPEGQIIYLNISRIINNRRAIEDSRQEKVEPLTLRGTRYVDFLVP
ncbi:MAG TPA: hypothetical protein VMT35_17490, partial [Ignavibacteriaceae bacterium]|nr:hypothetical protein [Ignavibacteriaceae bacterium]